MGDQERKTKAQRIERLMRRVSAMRGVDAWMIAELRGILKGLLDLLADEL